MDKINRRFDRIIFFLWIFLIVIGIISIFSASSTKIGDDFTVQNYYIKQIVFAVLSAVIIFGCIKIPYSIIDVSIIPGFIFSVILLFVVLFMPEINGSRRWINFGFYHFQPSELAKVTTILMLAKFISKGNLTDIQIILRGFGITIVPVMLIILEPDLGTTLIFWVILFSMLLTSRISNFYVYIIIFPVISLLLSFFLVIYFFILIGFIYYLYKKRINSFVIALIVIINIFFAVTTPVFWNNLKPYQQNRILTFLNPSRDPWGAGYQIIQAKIAMGSGGIFGKGFLEGTQKNLRFLPESHTDLIFSVIGEEFGFWGCFFIILLFYILILRMGYQSINLVIYERKLASIGIISYLVFQIFINIAMNMGAMPTTGVPLPFISYGGSSLLINSIAVGVLLKYLYERIFV